MGIERHRSQRSPLVTKALDAGARVTGSGLIEWDVAPRCEAPVTREFLSQRTTMRFTDPLGPQPDAIDMMAAAVMQHPVQVRDGRTVQLLVGVRCRKCPACLRARSALWRRRALSEVARSTRTWLSTYTLNMHEHYLVECKAREADAKNGDVFERRSDDSRFRCRAAIIGQEFTRYAKRVRKQSGSPLRYLVVTERHTGGGAADGLPHLHCLWHETDVDRPVRKSLLREQWRLGFSAHKLVTDKAQATYLCKYLAKEAVARVRCSRLYGEQQTV